MLWAWRPIPPSDLYYSLGDVVTTTDRAPILESLRCVHRDYLSLSPSPRHLVWSDEGTGGIDGAFWRVRGLNTFTVSGGTHEHPIGCSVVFHSDGYPQKCEIGPLQVTNKYGYRLLWKTVDSASQLPRRVSVWRPNVPDGCVMFGDYVTSEMDLPTLPQHKIIVCKDHWCFRQPIGYDLILHIPMGKNSIWIWRPKPPFDEYISLGDVCTRQKHPPSLSWTRCVKKSFVKEYRNYRNRVQIWADASKSTVHLGSLWLNPGTSNCFRAQKGTHVPPSSIEYDLIRDIIPSSERGGGGGGDITLPSASLSLSLTSASSSSPSLSSSSSSFNVLEVETEALEVLDALSDYCDEMNKNSVLFTRSFTLVKPLQLLLHYFSRSVSSSSSSHHHHHRRAASTGPAVSRDKQHVGGRRKRNKSQSRRKDTEEEKKRDGGTSQLSTSLSLSPSLSPPGTHVSPSPSPSSSSSSSSSQPHGAGHRSTDRDGSDTWPRPLAALSAQSTNRLLRWLDRMSLAVEEDLTQRTDHFFGRKVLIPDLQLKYEARELYHGHLLVSILPQPNTDHERIAKQRVLMILKPLFVTFSPKTMKGVGMQVVFSRMIAWFRRMLNKECETHLLFSVFPEFWDTPRVLGSMFCKLSARLLVELHSSEWYDSDDIVATLKRIREFEVSLPRELERLAPSLVFHEITDTDEMYADLYGPRPHSSPLSPDTFLRSISKRLAPVIEKVVSDHMEIMQSRLDRVIGHCEVQETDLSLKKLPSHLSSFETCRAIEEHVTSILDVFTRFAPASSSLNFFVSANGIVLEYSDLLKTRLRALVDESNPQLTIIVGNCVATINTLLSLSHTLSTASSRVSQTYGIKGGSGSNEEPRLDIEETESRLMKGSNNAVRCLSFFIASDLFSALELSISLTPWRELTDVVKQSPLVSSLESAIHSDGSVVWKVRGLLSPSFFASACSWVVTYFASRLLSALPATREMGTIGAQQLQLDVQGFRKVFSTLPVQTRLYKRHVHDAFLTFENTLKCMTCESEATVPMFRILFEKGNSHDLATILRLRGVSPIDIKVLVDLYTREVPPTVQMKPILKDVVESKNKINQTLKNVWNFVSRSSQS